MKDDGLVPITIIKGTSLPIRGLRKPFEHPVICMAKRIGPAKWRARIAGQWVDVWSYNIRPAELSLPEPKPRHRYPLPIRLRKEDIEMPATTPQPTSLRTGQGLLEQVRSGERTLEDLRTSDLRMILASLRMRVSNGNRYYTKAEMIEMIQPYVDRT